MQSWADTEDLGAEGLLGDVDADALDAQEARDRLALALRYLANWYRATKGSAGPDIWWSKIDHERALVEEAYRQASDMSSAGFLTHAAREAYKAASMEWAPLYRELKLSPDTLTSPGLIDEAASILTAPLAWVPTFTEGLAKSVDQSLSAVARTLAPWLLAGSAVAVLYIFRKPIGAVIAKVSA
jgi:hypothetical protein